MNQSKSFVSMGAMKSICIAKFVFTQKEFDKERGEFWEENEHQLVVSFHVKRRPRYLCEAEKVMEDSHDMILGCWIPISRSFLNPRPMAPLQPKWKSFWSAGYPYYESRVRACDYLVHNVWFISWDLLHTNQAFFHWYIHMR